MIDSVAIMLAIVVPTIAGGLQKFQYNVLTNKDRHESGAAPEGYEGRRFVG